MTQARSEITSDQAELYDVVQYVAHNTVLIDETAAGSLFRSQMSIRMTCYKYKCLMFWYDAGRVICENAVFDDCHGHDRIASGMVAVATLV
jgi:hypothetical protein